MKRTQRGKDREFGRDITRNSLRDSTEEIHKDGEQTEKHALIDRHNSTDVNRLK